MANKKDPPLNSREALRGSKGKMRYENGEIQIQPNAIYGGMLEESNVYPGSDYYTRKAYYDLIHKKATGGLTPAYPLFDALTMGLRAPLTAGAKLLRAPLTAGAKLLRSPIKNGVKKIGSFIDNIPSRINPNHFTPDPNMMYRGIGRSGMEDALASGLFRPKPGSSIKPILSNNGQLDIAKRFKNTYFTPNFKVADQYGKGFVAGVPQNAADFFKTYNKSNWSMSTRSQIPIEKGGILKKNWWSGYKPINKKLSDHVNIPGIQNSYLNQMAVPKGANMNIADDIFQGNTLYGKGEAFNRSEALNRISDFQKDLSPVPFTYTHGTGANALEGIFKNRGLVGASELKKSGKLVTGEDLVYQKAAGHLYDDGIRTTQNRVSTASIANPGAAADYALEYGKGANNYPVVFGINPKAGASSRMSIPGGNIAGEAQFSGKIGLDEISNVFVPDAQKASFTKQYGDRLENMRVGSFEDYLNEAKKFTRGNKIKGSSPYDYKKGGKIKLKKKK